MQLIPSGIRVPFEVTYDSPSLFVGMTVFDVTTGSPVQVGSLIPMVNVIGNSYLGLFIPTDQHIYMIYKNVYTDVTYSTISPNYAAGTEAAFASTFQNMTAMYALIQSLSGLVNSAQYVGAIIAVVNSPVPGLLVQQQNTAQIVQGSQAALLCRLFNGQSNDPYNLTGFYDIQTCFQNEDGSELMLSLQNGDIEIIGNPLLGKIQINIGAADTALFEVTTLATLELSFIVSMGSDPIKVQIPSAYNVLQSEC